MTVPADDAPGRTRPPVADLVLTTGLLVLFALALRQTFDWSLRTSLFPRMVTVAGCVLCLALLVRLAVPGLRRQKASPAAVLTAAAAGPGPVTDDGPQLVDEDEEHDHEVEYVYATAGRVAWAQALGWIALFLVLLRVAGLFVASAVFAFCYLRFGASRSWRLSVVYAVVLTAVLYAFFGVLLDVSVPEGLWQ